MKTGIHEVPEREYHADRASLSVTGAKKLRKNPMKFRYALDHPTHKSEFDFGHVAHELVLGKGAGFRVLDFDSWRTKDAREARDQAYAEGLAPILQADFVKAQAMADKVKQHEVASLMFTTGQAEKAIYAQHEETGVTLRGRADWIYKRANGATCVVDLKTCASADPEDVDRAMDSYGYAMQAAWYTDLLAANGIEPVEFWFVFVEKEPPHAINVALASPDVIKYGRELNELAIRQYKHCLDHDYWPDYNNGATSVANIPAYAWTRLEKQLEQEENTNE